MTGESFPCTTMSTTTFFLEDVPWNDPRTLHTIIMLEPALELALFALGVAIGWIASRELSGVMLSPWL